MKDENEELDRWMNDMETEFKWLDWVVLACVGITALVLMA